MDTGYKCKARKYRIETYYTYEGKLERWEDNRKLWTTDTNIRRISRADALRDARQLVHDTILRNFENNI